MGDIHIDGMVLSASMCRVRDWKDVVWLMRISFPELTADQISYDIRSKGRHTCLFRYQGELVAYWMLNNNKGPKVAKPEQAAIHPNWRRRRLGMPIFKDFTQFAAWIGFEEIHSSVLKANKVSLTISEAIGFLPFPDKTEDRILLIKKASAADSFDWTPPSRIKFPHHKNRILYPREMSRIEKLMTRFLFKVAVPSTNS